MIAETFAPRRSLVNALLLAGSAFLALLSSPSAQQVIQKPHAVREWITACDWTHNCPAFALSPEASSQHPAKLPVSITRDHRPEPIAQLKIDVPDDVGQASVRDGMRLLIDGDSTGVPVRESHDLALTDQDGAVGPASFGTVRQEIDPLTVQSEPGGEGIPAGLIAQGVDCAPENTGLDWGLCNIPELRIVSRDIGAGQYARMARMDPTSGQALMADWDLMLQSLRREVGPKWYDVVKPDVAAALLQRRGFLERFSPRAGLDGEWENYESRIEIYRDEGLILLHVASPSCDVRVVLDREVTVARRADSLLLSMSREGVERLYPVLGGCFAGRSGPSVIDGVYFPVASSDR